MPEHLGQASEISRLPGSKDWIIFLEDAHAMPEAQSNIRGLIDFFQKEYGVTDIAVEGAPGMIDPLYLRAFPSAAALEEILEEYNGRAELTGSMAAALMNEREARFTGLEDWAVYEEGYGHFLSALGENEKALPVLSEWRRGLDERKKIYSAGLAAVDRALQEFYAGGNNLPELLMLLARHARPEPGSMPALLLQRFEADAEDEKLLQEEAKRISALIFEKLKNLPVSKEKRAGLSLFHSRFQDFQTSVSDAGDFLLDLSGLNGRFSLGVDFSRAAEQSIEGRRLLHSLRADEWGTELDGYVSSVKEGLFQSGEERALDRETAALFLFERLAALELTRRQWEELEERLDDKTVPEGLAEGLRFHLDFYRNAVERDGIFAAKLAAIAKNKGPAPKVVVCVAGGFHTSGMKRIVKESGFSYAVVRPRITTAGGESPYKAQMKGELSWRSYFEVKEGRVDVYEAFTRSVRDALLERRTAQRGRLLKHWRDNLLRRLAVENRLHEAADYTRFIDELTEKPKSWDAAGLKRDWLRNLDGFMNKLESAEKKEGLNFQNVSRLLAAASYMPAGAKAAAGVPSASMDPAHLGLSSSVRSGRKPNVSGTPLGIDSPLSGRKPNVSGTPLGIDSPRSELRRREEMKVIRHETQGDGIRNTFFMDPENRVHFHSSVRHFEPEENDGMEFTDLRAFLPDGFIGFRARVRKGIDVTVPKTPVRTLTREEDGRKMKGVEFAVSVKIADSAPEGRIFDLPILEAGSGLSIRDRIRMKREDLETSLDPKAAENIRGLMRAGEYPYPVEPPVEDTTVIDGKSMRRITFRNTIQHGQHAAVLELLFPEEISVEILRPEGQPPSLRVRVPEKTFRFNIQARLLSTHDALTYYSQEQIYRPEILAFRQSLKERVDEWESERFLRPVRARREGKRDFERRLSEYEDLFDAYKLKLRELKKFLERPAVSGPARNDEVLRLNQALVKSVEDHEELMGQKGFLAPGFEGVRLLLRENKFDDLVLLKFETYNDSLYLFQFLLSEEVMLAGSWQYLSYFGRDTILTARVLQNVVQPRIFQNLFQSVLDRVYTGGPAASEAPNGNQRPLHVKKEGEVAHEEDPRYPSNHERRLDYRMMDGEFMFMTLARDFMRMKEFSPDEKKAFWDKKSLNRPDWRSDLPNAEILKKSVRYVLDKALEKALIGMKDVNADGIGDPTGNWRDAMNSLARAMYPGDVNYEWVYSALLSIRELEKSFAELGLPSPVPEGYAVDDELMESWKKRIDDFTVVFNTKEEQLERLIPSYRAMLMKGGEEVDYAVALMVSSYTTGDPAHYRRAFEYWKNQILPPVHAPEQLNLHHVNAAAVERMLGEFRLHFLADERAEDFFVFPALGKGLKGDNIEVPNGDYSTFAPFNRDLSIRELALAISPVLRHAAYGGLLWEEVGLVFTANPVFAKEFNEFPVRFFPDERIPSIREMLGRGGYHGMVMWMSMVNLMTEGLSRQVMHHLELAESLALAGNHAESAVHLEAARNTFLAVGLIRGNVNKLGSLKGEETIQIIIDPLTGQPLPGPFIDGIESNPAQAWNAAEIRVHTILEELVERAAKVEASILAVPRLEPRGFYPSIESLWQAARNGDPAIKAEVRRWTERTLKNGRIVSSSGRRSELRTNADALVQESAPRADDSELRTDANASVPKSARIVDQSEPRTDADALVQESARIAGRSELSSSALPEADAAAKRIEPAALLLAPRAELRARVSESAKEEGARFIVSIGKGKPAALKEIRAALESAIDSVLREYTPQESGSLIDENYGLYLRIIEHKKGRLLNLMKKLAAGPSDAGDKKVSIGLSIPDAEEELGHTAAGDYAAFFRQYFLGKIDRLILTGKEGSSLAAPLREDGFLVHTERKIRKVLLLSGQKKFPLLVSGMDLPEAADDSVEPIGIHLAPEVRRETAALARLAQIVYGFAYAMSAESEGEHDAVREQIVRALLLDHDFEAAAGGIILSNKDGHFYIDAAALELQAALEIQRALDISA